MARRYRAGFALPLLFVGTVLVAQSNDTIDAILAEQPATVGSAAYIALSAAGLISDDASAQRAVSAAKDTGWLPEDADAGSPVTFGRFAYLLMEATGVDGGLMYRILPGPRYAAREFVYRNWSPERRAPGDTISGRFLVGIAGIFLEATEGSR